MGYGVKDKHPTIIHHYAFNEEENKRVVYPLFAAGFLISVELLKRSVKQHCNFYIKYIIICLF